MKKVLVMILLYVAAVVELVWPPAALICGAFGYFKDCLAEGVGMPQLWISFVYGVSLALVSILAIFCSIALFQLANSVSDVMD